MPKVFMEYKAMVEKQKGKKIKFVQSDNEMEYCNRDFDTFLAKQGILRRLTVAHTPEQNGIAERKNRTLCETARCLMIGSDISQGFWAEAISTANYLRNRCPSNSINGKTPFELWFGRVPILNHLRSFGCKAIALNKSQTKGKFDARGRECVLIGYSETAKAYRVWFPAERKVEATRDIVFLENSPADMKYSDFIDDETLHRQNAKGSASDHTWVEFSTPPTTGENETRENELGDDGDAMALGEECDQPVTDVSEHRGPGRPRTLRGCQEDLGRFQLEQDHEAMKKYTEVSLRNSKTRNLRA